jgi:hypothetical protein
MDPEQWMILVPEELRYEILDHKRQKCDCQEPSPCTCGWQRPYDASDERDLFVSLCLRPTYSIGPVFFHFAAAVLRTGVLLLVSDQRNPGNCTYQAWDFGTAEYPRSMIIQSLLLPSEHKDSHGIGHYETLGLPNNGPEATHMTLFPHDHPVLSALRHFSSHPTPSGSPPIFYSCYHAISLPDPPAPSSSSVLHHTLPLAAVPAPSTPDPTRPHRKRLAPSAPGSTRPHRKRLAPERVRDSTSVYYPKEAKRVPLDPLTATSLTAPSRSVSTPVVITANTSDEAPAPVGTGPDMQEAAQPPPPVCPAHTLLTGTDVLANLRHWIRRTGHGRLAARVHFSAKPMWILRCRTVLLDLAASLRCVPIDVAAVVTHLAVLWMLPREVFTIPSRGGAANQRLKYNRIHRRLADDGLLNRLSSQVIDRDVSTT